MGRYNYYDYYFKPSTPIATDEGIKAKSKRGDFVKNWWATRWIKALERLLDRGRLSRGRNYARRGQVLSIKETPTGVEARVQGSRPTPYKVSIELKSLSDGQWDKVIETLAEQAIFTAQLLAGEMPAEIEEVFEAAGVSLFPGKKSELVTRCSCPDYANPCKHIAAVHYILGEQFDEDPFLIFRLRGRSQEQTMAALRARRVTDHEPGETEAEVEELAVPLETAIDHYWEMGEPLTHLKTNIKPPVASLPVLKRLGQPSFVKEDIQQVLGPAYQAITATALKTAYGGEREDAPDEEAQG